MKLLRRFGSLYTFPDSQIALSDNFGDLVTRTRRLPFAHGGFDELGQGRGLSEIGNVRADLWLHFSGAGEAKTKLDELRALADYGVQRLIMLPDDGGTERWCMARLSSVQTPQDAHNVPHKRQKVQLTFQVSDPFWVTAGNGVVWGGGWKWGDGTKWGGGSTTTYTGASNAISLTNNGNAFTQPTLSVKVPAAKSVTDPTFRRIVNGAVIDEVRYIGTLAATDHLFIDCRRLKVWKNGVAVYGSNFVTKNSYWMRLLPGANTLLLLMTLATDQANVRIHYAERWV